MKKNCFGISILMSGWCCTHSSKIIWHKYTWLRIPASKWFERPKNIRLASDINGTQKLVITHLRFLGCTHMLADRWSRHLSRTRPKEGRPPSGDSVRTQFDAARLVCLKTGWWFGSFFSIYWECHNPNWRTPSFFRGVGIPPTTRWWRSQKGVISTENMVMKGCPIFASRPLSDAGCQGSSQAFWCKIYWKEQIKKQWRPDVVRWSGWLVVWNMNFMTFHILGIIILTDYPLVICYIAIENGHRNSWYTHQKMVIFHSFLLTFTRGGLPEGHIFQRGRSTINQVVRWGLKIIGKS